MEDFLPQQFNSCLDTLTVQVQVDRYGNSLQQSLMIDEVRVRKTTGREHDHWTTILISTCSNKRVKIYIHNIQK